jgi:Cu2+-exporting ATPase
MITGEATLVFKGPGASVISGSLNHSGELMVRLSRLTGDNTVKTIGVMVDEAKSSKARFQEIADRVAGYFVPVILFITLATFVTWIGVGKGVRHYSTSQTCINAMTYAISALIVSCPCAIGLAVPMVLVIAGGVAAKHGVIFKTAETIERARKISHVVFDKTGTLTEGRLTVEQETYPTKNEAILRPMIAALVSSSNHPVAKALFAHLDVQNSPKTDVENIKSLPGRGLKANWGEDDVCAGNPYWLGVHNLPSVKLLLSSGLTVFCITVNKGLVGVYGLRDGLRAEAVSTISILHSRGIAVSIVSGDSEESVKLLAHKLQIPQSHVRFRCSPEDKQDYVRSISHDHSTVMFCGDGTNDAVALAEASIGMHMSDGTAIAKSASDAVLIRSNLSGVIILMDLSQAFYRRVVFNFAWAFIYNTFAILLAAGAFPNVRIEPKYAGLGEIVSVLPVIAIGIQLKWAKFTMVDQKN